MTTREMLALEWCVRLHAGQTDKAGKPYSTHPIRVAWSLYQGTSEEVVCAALLHDLVEDCGIQLGEIETWFGKRVAEAVDALSRRNGETYADFIERCKQNPIARRVKLADIADNTLPERMACLPESERGIKRRYLKAKQVLQSYGTHAPLED